MRVLRNHLLLVLYIAGTAVRVSSSEVQKKIQEELSAIHGPNWEAVLSVEGADRNQIRQELKQVFFSKSNGKGETRENLFNDEILVKRAVSEFGHFAQASAEGDMVAEDLGFLKDAQEYFSEKKKSTIPVAYAYAVSGTPSGAQQLISLAEEYKDLTPVFVNLLELNLLGARKNEVPSRYLASFYPKLSVSAFQRPSAAWQSKLPQVIKGLHDLGQRDDLKKYEGRISRLLVKLNSSRTGRSTSSVETRGSESEQSLGDQRGKREVAESYSAKDSNRNRPVDLGEDYRILVLLLLLGLSFFGIFYLVRRFK